MTVAELIEVLKQQPQDLQVARPLYSEHVLLTPTDISVKLLSKPRDDGWIHDSRVDKPGQRYLVVG